MDADAAEIWCSEIDASAGVRSLGAVMSVTPEQSAAEWSAESTKVPPSPGPEDPRLVIWPHAPVVEWKLKKLQLELPMHKSLHDAESAI